MNRPVQAISKAAVIAVGSELLTPDRQDTNSLIVTRRLNELGVDVVAKHIVGDRQADLAWILADTLVRVELVIVTGGLGPTGDDITRAAVAEALGLTLQEDPEVLAAIERRFAARGLRMPGINRRQALVPLGSHVLVNEHGSAPALVIESAGRLVILLPGPPHEMTPLLDRSLGQFVAPRTGSLRLRRRVVVVAGRTESQVDELVQPLYARWTEGRPPVSTTVLASAGQIELHLSTRAAAETEAEKVLDDAVRQLEDVLGRDVVSTDGRSIEQVVGDRLRARGWRIAVAESCTGGLMLSRLTDVAGSSDYVDRGVVAYSNRSKIELLGVSPALLSEYGAVSAPVAEAMARGIRDRTGVEVGVGITGIAGPTGGSPDKPVGTVVMAAIWPGGQQVKTFRFPGARDQVKRYASQAALDLVRRALDG